MIGRFKIEYISFFLKSGLPPRVGRGGIHSFPRASRRLKGGAVVFLEGNVCLEGSFVLDRVTFKSDWDAHASSSRSLQGMVLDSPG
jgi:hypothetical protein